MISSSSKPGVVFAFFFESLDALVFPLKLAASLRSLRSAKESNADLPARKFLNVILTRRLPRIASLMPDESPVTESVISYEVELASSLAIWRFCSATCAKSHSRSSS